jgi:hypothetical protein
MKLFWLIQWRDGSWSRWTVDAMPANVVATLRGALDVQLWKLRADGVLSPTWRPAVGARPEVS